MFVKWVTDQQGQRQGEGNSPDATPEAKDFPVYGSEAFREVAALGLEDPLTQPGLTNSPIGNGAGLIGEEDLLHEDSDAEDEGVFEPDPLGFDIPFDPTTPGSSGRAADGDNLNSWRAADAHHLDEALHRQTQRSTRRE